MTDELDTCPECGTSFWRDEPWKRLCLACWKASRPPSERGSHPSSRLALLELENARLRRQLVALEQRIETERVTFPDGMLGRLIRLSHPDKHGNSEAANLATQWLLSLRERQP